MKILVTTDFSNNSKAAIRFALMLAKQSKEIELTFYHAVQFMKPTVWSDAFFKEYTNSETERLEKHMKKFVLSVIGSEIKKLVGIKYVIDSAYTIDEEIINYAAKGKYDYICIATKGAGLLRKIIGTHTANLVNNSNIPLLVIPSVYRSKPLKKVTYLSDFENVLRELKVVSKFANAVKSKLDVLHYSSIIFDDKKFEKNKALFDKEENKAIQLNILKHNLELPIVKKVSQYINKEKPELLVMFTNKERSFYERIFLPSISKQLTYTTTVPVLIISK